MIFFFFPNLFLTLPLPTPTHRNLWSHSLLKHTERERIEFILFWSTTLKHEAYHSVQQKYTGTLQWRKLIFLLLETINCKQCLITDGTFCPVLFLHTGILSCFMSLTKNQGQDGSFLPLLPGCPASLSWGAVLGGVFRRPQVRDQPSAFCCQVSNCWEIPISG